MKVLITGRSGTGKSTICRQLIDRGFSALDADRVEGFVGWYDLRTRKKVVVDYSKPIDKTKVGWLWQHEAMKALVAKYDDLYLCGSADNQLDFYKYFDNVFVLDLPPETQKQRISQRTEHDYGKHPDMLETIITEQRQLVEKSRELGASIIDAESSPSQLFEIIKRGAA